jgi:hypothetical protein
VALQWPAMKRSPPLFLEPRASRLGRLFVLAGGVTTAALILWLPLARELTTVALFLIAHATIDGVRRCADRGVPASLHVGTDRRITVRDRDGHVADGTILDGTYVGTCVTTIVWRADSDGSGWRRLRPARAIVVLPDTLPADDFRRLRVVLRYGRVARPERGTSGATAG